MTKKTKAWLFTALCLILAGTMVFLYALAALDFDFSKLSTEKYVTNTYEITDSFESIFVSVDVTDIEILPAKDGICRVICEEPESRQHRVMVEGDTLRIKETDTKKWYDHIGIFWGENKVTIYLPVEDYKNISVETDTGDIRLIDLHCQQLSVNVDTGDVRLEDVICAEIFMETDTGDVKLKDCDAASIDIETDTGDVTGSLLTEKVFLCKSSTGDITVPESISGGKCKIETDTGDIEITIAR